MAAVVWLRRCVVATRALLALVPMASWTIVMTCGVVSIDLASDHAAVLSAILFWVGVAVWVLLMGALAGPLVVQDGRLWREAASPAVLTIVAATAVLGSRVASAHHRAAATTLLGLAACEWVALSGPVLRRWVTPTRGVSFVLSVATESVALLTATLSVAYRSRWLCWLAMALVLVGLCVYGLAVATFDLGALSLGRGDQWIAGGALAISALAAATATDAADTLGVLSREHHLLADGTVVLWCAAVAWIPALIVAEARHPRLSYDLGRWATAFPVGMYAACSLGAGRVAGSAAITTFARVWTWLALGVTLVLFAGLFRRLGHHVRAYADHVP